jgi:hypothetical protein
VHRTRPHDRTSASRGAVGATRHEEPLDDWLGEISDEDWSEGAAGRSEPARADTPIDDPRLEPTRDLAEPARADSRAEARRAAIERRRYTAGLVLVVALGLAVAIPVLLLRGGGGSDVAPVGDVAATTPSDAGSSASPTTTATPPTVPSDTATTSATQPSTTPQTTEPSTSDAATFTLPEDTKLVRGEGDPVLIRELQQALLTAGYDPGPADGTFGQRTEAAVVAFQQAHGLSVDGRVGPETAAALNAAVANG